MNENAPDKPSDRSRNFAEWLSFSVAIFLVAILVFLVLYSWSKQENTPPIITLQIEEEVRREEGQFYVPFTVTNTGGTTAASVRVVGQLLIEGELEEAGEQEINFLSGGEEASGVFIFTRNPEKGILTIRVTGYKLP
ncbi:MAG: TIGR02588 family protein [Cyanobacteriota bacterium]|nr:TIGR02588 family protein [Cyanobacteriota bacterium]